MPDLVVSNEGERFLLDITLREASPTIANWRLHIFENDYTPNRDVELADLTEPVWGGYAPQNIDRANWIAAVTSDGQAVSIHGDNPFLFTPSSTGGPCYGFFVTDQGDTVLLWAKRFDDLQNATPLSPCVVRLDFAGRSQSEPV